jgi:hypothetical protein
LLSKEGKHAEAEQIEREVLSVHTRVLGAEHPDTLTSSNNLAVSLSLQGKYAEAECVIRDVLHARRRALGEDHLETLKTAENLVGSLWGQHKYEEAELIQREVLDVRRQVLGNKHHDTRASEKNLTRLLSLQGKLVDVERIEREVGTLAVQRWVPRTARSNPSSTAEDVEYGCRSQMSPDPRRSRTTKAGGSRARAAPTAHEAPYRMRSGAGLLLQRFRLFSSTVWRAATSTWGIDSKTGRQPSC